MVPLPYTKVMTSRPVRTLFCPECGKETSELYDNRCSECFLSTLTLIKCPSVLKIRVCPVCGAHFTAGKWVRETDQRDVLFHEITGSITLHPDAKHEELDISEEELDQSRFLVHVTINAVVSGLNATATVDVEVRVKKETCDTCSRIAGGYYAGIVQLRADNRIISETEVDRCIKLADRLLNKLTEKGDHFAFVSKVEELKEGVDLYIGSAASCKQVCRAIIRELGGSYTTSPSLVGKKDGEDLYRITCAMRLPEFIRGDILAIRDLVVEVTHQDKQIHGTDLTDGHKVSLGAGMDAPAAKIGSRNDATMTVLVAIEGDTVQILDPETYKTILLKKPVFLSEDSGSEVCVVKTNEGVFLLPKILNSR